MPRIGPVVVGINQNQQGINRFPSCTALFSVLHYCSEVTKTSWWLSNLVPLGIPFYDDYLSTFRSKIECVFVGGNPGNGNPRLSSIIEGSMFSHSHSWFLFTFLSLVGSQDYKWPEWMGTVPNYDKVCITQFFARKIQLVSSNSTNYTYHNKIFSV